jgi:hypothetical protein
VILRALVDTSSGHGTFAGTITGGNARGFSPAQTFSYAFDVPSGKRDLDVALTMANDPGDTLETILVDPTGETPSVESNSSADGSGATTASAVNVVADPAPGRWRYVVVVQNPVTGNEPEENFTGTVTFDQQTVSGLGAFPQHGETLARGVAHTITLRVFNPRPAAIAVQADARYNSYVQRQLAPQFAGSTVPLPLSVDDLSNIPGYLVPPDTTHVDLSAASTVPAQVELTSPGGGIDVFGDLTAAQGGSTISTASVNEVLPEHVAQGIWSTYVQEIGPYGDGGAPAGSSTLVANATMKGFESSITSSVGDVFRAALDPTADTGTPVLIPAGGSALITVTIKPNAAKGLKINGVLNLVTPPTGVDEVFNTTGDVLTSLPYSYTVG